MQFLIINEEAQRCEALKTLLRQLYRYAHFIEVKDSKQAEQALKRNVFDLCVVDWPCGVMTSADIGMLCQQFPRLHIALLTNEKALSWVVEMLNAGVLGIVPRDMDPRLIIRALELALLGGYYVPVHALDATLPTRLSVARAISLGGSLERKPGLSTPTLSPRQQQIMRLVHLGNTNKVIARTLGISEGTVKIHLASIFRQLGATNRAAAVAIYNGWQYGALRLLHSDVPFPPTDAWTRHGVQPRRGWNCPDTANGVRHDNTYVDVAEPLAAYRHSRRYKKE